MPLGSNPGRSVRQRLAPVRAPLAAQASRFWFQDLPLDHLWDMAPHRETREGQFRVNALSTVTYGDSCVIVGESPTPPGFGGAPIPKPALD